MKARDVLTTDEGIHLIRDEAVDVLLAQTPEGEGVYIAPDGTLMRACEAVATTRFGKPLDPDPDATHRRAWMGDLCECGADWPCPSVDPEEEP